MHRMFQNALLLTLIFLFSISFDLGASEKERGLLVVTSPQEIPKSARPKIFLAGSIDMGTAENWQQTIVEKLSDANAIILNPRRTDWNRAWKPELSDRHFEQQVNWELSALDQADIIVMYLAPSSQSPVSLMELGLHAKSGRVIVLCPEGYWRKGNVDAVVARYRVETARSMDDLVGRIKVRLQSKGHD